MPSSTSIFKLARPDTPVPPATNTFISRDDLDKSITVGSDLYNVIGVLPSRSSYVAPGVNLWLPIEPMASLPFMRNRDVCFLTVVSRLGRGEKVSEALAELSSIQRRDQISYPGVDAGHGVHLQTLRDFVVGPRSHSLIIVGAATAAVGPPTLPYADEMLTMLPLPCRSIARISYVSQALSG